MGQGSSKETEQLISNSDHKKIDLEKSKEENKVQLESENKIDFILTNLEKEKLAIDDKFINVLNSAISVIKDENKRKEFLQRLDNIKSKKMDKETIDKIELIINKLEKLPELQTNDFINEIKEFISSIKDENKRKEFLQRLDKIEENAKKLKIDLEKSKQTLGLLKIENEVKELFEYLSIYSNNLNEVKELYFSPEEKRERIDYWEKVIEKEKKRLDLGKLKKIKSILESTRKSISERKDIRDDIKKTLLYDIDSLESKITPYIEEQKRVREIFSKLDKPKDIKTFLSELIKLGEEKKTITYGDFTKPYISKNIADMIIRKYQNTCGKMYIKTKYKEEEKKFYIEEEDIQVDKIIKCIKKLIYKQIVVYFSSDNIDLKAGHANILLIRPGDKVLIRFDPNGMPDEKYDEQYGFVVAGEKLAELINEKLQLKEEKDKYKYQNINEKCPALKFQKEIGKIENTTETEAGTCQLWSRLYSELLLAFPDMDYEDIFKTAVTFIKDRKNKDDSLNLIRGYFWKVKEDLEKAGIFMIEKIDLEKEKQEKDLIKKLESEIQLIFTTDYSSYSMEIDLGKKMEILNTLLSKTKEFDNKGIEDIEKIKQGNIKEIEGEISSLTEYKKKEDAFKLALKNKIIEKNLSGKNVDELYEDIYKRENRDKYGVAPILMENLENLFFDDDDGINFEKKILGDVLNEIKIDLEKSKQSELNVDKSIGLLQRMYDLGKRKIDLAKNTEEKKRIFEKTIFDITKLYNKTQDKDLIDKKNQLFMKLYIDISDISDISDIEKQNLLLQLPEYIRNKRIKKIIKNGVTLIGEVDKNNDYYFGKR